MKVKKEMDDGLLERSVNYLKKQILGRNNSEPFQVKAIGNDAW
jgi:hypothetical protein